MQKVSILIIEDELPAYQKLYKLITSDIPNHALVGWARTVTEATHLIRMNKLDVIFSDIELLDGTSFDVFLKEKVHCPIIFTTAYNQYLFEAFQTNGIAYLLKPFDDAQFVKVVEKYKNVYAMPKTSLFNKNTLEAIQDQLHQKNSNYERRLSVKKQS